MQIHALLRINLYQSKQNDFLKEPSNFTKNKTNNIEKKFELNHQVGGLEDYYVLKKPMQRLQEDEAKVAGGGMREERQKRRKRALFLNQRHLLKDPRVSGQPHVVLNNKVGIFLIFEKKFINLNFYFVYKLMDTSMAVLFDGVERK